MSTGLRTRPRAGSARMVGAACPSHSPLASPASGKERSEAKSANRAPPAARGRDADESLIADGRLGCPPGQQGATARKPLDRSHDGNIAGVEQGVIGAAAASEPARVRERGLHADGGAAHLQCHDGLAGSFGLLRQCSQARTVPDAFDNQADNARGLVADQEREEIQHIDIGFIADRDEFAKPSPEASQAARDPGEQRAAVRDHRNIAGLDELLKLGIVTELHPVHDVEDAVGIGTEDSRPGRAGNIGEGGLALDAFILTGFGKAACPDNGRADTGIGTLLHRFDHIARRNDEHGAVGALGQRSDRRKAGQAFDLPGRRVNGKDTAGKAAVDEIVKDPVAALSRSARCSNDGNTFRLKEGTKAIQPGQERSSDFLKQAAPSATFL